MKRMFLVSIAVVGALLTTLCALAFEMSVADAASVAGWAAAAAATAGLAGAAALWASRRSSIGMQVAIVSLTSIGAVAAGAIVSANKMFFSLHDLRSLLVVLIAAGTVGLIIAMVLGDRVARASATLREATERIGAGEVFRTPEARSAAEFDELAKQLEMMSARLEEARRRERTLDTSRRELIAWVAHDLRTPLAGIRAMAEALEDGVVVDTETTARYHRAMRVETDRLAGLVDDLFELSRINAGALMLQMERASLGDLVSDALAAAAATAEARGVKLKGHLTSDSPELDLSVPEMARVLRNLLENAIRHTPVDGTVTVEAGIEAERAYFAVADACGGIPQADIARVFDVAFRGESARTPGDGGAGLGLAIARGIVKAHHGEIDVRNEGEGCRFVVRLPLKGAADRA
jgi:signal transduction histidine kinase